MTENTRCKVACEWLDGGVTLRYSESRDWSSEEDALSYAAGCHRSGKYSSIRVRYSRKRMGRWQNAGSVAYPPNAEVSDRANNQNHEYSKRLNCRANPRFDASGWFGVMVESGDALRDGKGRVEARG